MIVLDNHNKPIPQRMKADIYVDNLASGTDNEASVNFNHSRSIISSANFNLREWNSSKICTLAKEENAQDVSTETKVLCALGLITPVTIRAKIFLQELWELKYAWDEPLPGTLIEKCLELSKDLESLIQIEFQRRYFPKYPHGIQMQYFTSLSTQAWNLTG